MIGSSMCVDNNIFLKSPYIFQLTVQYHVVKIFYYASKRLIIYV